MSDRGYASFSEAMDHQVLKVLSKKRDNDSFENIEASWTVKSSWETPHYWAPAIERFFERLAQYADQEWLETLVIQQVKEKHSSLCIYYDIIDKNSYEDPSFYQEFAELLDTLLEQAEEDVMELCKRKNGLEN